MFLCIRFILILVVPTHAVLLSHTSTVIISSSDSMLLSLSMEVVAQEVLTVVVVDYR